MLHDSAGTERDEAKDLLGKVEYKIMLSITSGFMRL